MTPRTTREKWMLATLPALATLFIGWLAFLRPASERLETLGQRVEKQGPLNARQALIKQAKAECASLQKLITSQRRALITEMAGFDRNLAMQQVSALCAEHGLSLNTTTVDTAAKLPAALQEAGAAMTLADSKASLPQVWRIEMSGAYANVVGLLEGLQQSQPLIVPLNLSMETGRNERVPAKWVLTLWL